MWRKTLDDLIERGRQLAETLRVDLDEKQRVGFELISHNVNNGGLGVGIGPPGTGKTVVFNSVHAEVFDNIEEKEIILHVAPTNRLVEETAVRTIALLIMKGYDINSLRNMVRVYGSRFEPQRLDKNVKLVITTGYQPGALTFLSGVKESVHLMIDEASTTALHEAFIPLSMSLANEIKRKNIKFIGSFNVIGDPMQAIVESSRWKYEQLIVYRMILAIIPEKERDEVERDPPKMFEIAEKYANSSEVRYFFLNSTYRMPRPTEQLVSIPFYNGKLMAIKGCSDVLRGIATDNSQTRSFISEAKYLSKLNKVVDAIDNSLDSLIPVVYIVDKGQAYSSESGRRLPELNEYDKFRALLGAEVAAYVALRTHVPKVLLVAPYNEVVQQASQYVHSYLRKHLSDRVNSISFGTIHAVLGSEADVVVAVMGKEYIGEEYETMYFQMPELINVQLSRHSKMLIVIGNIEKLSKNMVKKGEGYKHVSKIIEVIKDLEDKDLVKIVRCRETECR